MVKSKIVLQNRILKKEKKRSMRLTNEVIIKITMDKFEGKLADC